MANEPVEKPVSTKSESVKLPETEQKQTSESSAKATKTSTPKIGDLKSLLKGGVKKEAAPDVKETPKKADKPFTPQQLRSVWLQFAEQRKAYQMEYHMLLQEYDFIDNKVIVHLHNNFQESLLNTIKLDLLTFLRETLGNNSILLGGDMKTVADDDRRVLYTNRDKFDHLMEKNPLVRELKDKFGLDTDF